MCDIDIHCLTHLRSILCRILTFCRVGTRVLTSDTEDERKQIREKKQWFKGNLHMHTTLSDGRVSPSEAIERYRKNGYDFIAITDHRCPGITVEPGEDGYFGAETVEAGNMLLLSGVEWDTGGANTDLPGDTSCAHILGIGMTPSAWTAV